MSRYRLRISELASLVGVTAKTIRHYHTIGLLDEPERSESSYRLYNATHLVRLNRIVRLKALGFSLSQIQDIFSADNRDEALRTALDQRYDELRALIDDLTAQLDKVSHYRADHYRLHNIELPDNPGKNYHYVKERMVESDDMPEAFIYDSAFMAELDSINWPLSVHKAFQERVNRSADDPDLQAYRRKLLQELVRIRDLPEDDPEIVSAAWGVIQTEGGRKMSAIGKERMKSMEIYERLLEDTVELLAAERYTPAQYRFVITLKEMLLR
ncbi:MAG: MerR family transcriptional regulator [Chloroflexota bacterium]